MIDLIMLIPFDSKIEQPKSHFKKKYFLNSCKQVDYSKENGIKTYFKIHFYRFDEFLFKSGMIVKQDPGAVLSPTTIVIL
jgi:hypothetical protein